MNTIMQMNVYRSVLGGTERNASCNRVDMIMNGHSQCVYCYQIEKSDRIGRGTMPTTPILWESTHSCIAVVIWFDAQLLHEHCSYYSEKKSISNSQHLFQLSAIHFLPTSFHSSARIVQ